MDLRSAGFSDTNIADNGSNLLKFYMAHCINEIINRYRMNCDKRRQIYLLKEHLLDSKQMVFQENPRAAYQSAMINLTDFKDAVAEKLGDFEAERIGGYFTARDMHVITFEDAIHGVTQLFEEDLDEIIAQSFDKLDITDEAKLSVKYIRQGLLVNGRTHVTPILKTHNKELLKFVYDMRSTKTFGKVEFGQYVRKCLEHDKDPNSTMRSNNQSGSGGSSGDRFRDENQWFTRALSSSRRSGSRRGIQRGN